MSVPRLLVAHLLVGSLRMVWQALAGWQRMSWWEGIMLERRRQRLQEVH